MKSLLARSLVRLAYPSCQLRSEGRKNHELVGSVGAWRVRFVPTTVVAEHTTPPVAASAPFLGRSCACSWPRVALCVRALN